MTNLKEIYKCDVCGNIVEVLHTGQGELVCCGQSMILQEEKDEGVGFKKHVPVLEYDENGAVITVGKEVHPMQEEHLIEWVEVVFENGNSFRTFIASEDSPKVRFHLNEGIIKVRAYCNLHGLWVNNLL